MLIRPPDLADLSEAARLLAVSFPPALRPYMTYTQRGAENFLSLPLRYPDLSWDRTSLVAVRDGSVAAFADFRRMDADLTFLSYICVSPEARRQGLASRLIRHHLEAGDPERMELDVFEDNVLARALYESMGFQECGSTYWWVKALPAPHRAGRMAARNLPSAHAMFDLYGFCEIELTDERGTSLKVGRLGEGVLRVFSQEVFLDPSIFERLAGLFPEAREVLWIGDRASVEGAELVNRSLRMRADFGAAKSGTAPI